MSGSGIDRLVSQAMAVEAESAQEAGTLGYMARAMVQATMPHRDTKELRHERRNGDYTLTMLAGSAGVGLPYGSIPRLMLAWIGAEALRTGQREIVLGDTMSAFLRELGLVPYGGRWGTITRLKEQSLRLFSCAISCSYMTDGRAVLPEVFSLGKADLWWEPRSPEQKSLFRSTLTLSESFHRELIEHPVPLDLRVLQALKRSPLALDVYAWTVYRLHTLNHSGGSSVLIPWASLRIQFGAGYADTSQGLRDFRKAFLRELVKVRAFYPEARVSDEPNGLLLKRSPEHLPARPRQRRIDRG